MLARIRAGKAIEHYERSGAQGRYALNFATGRHSGDAGDSSRLENRGRIHRRCGSERAENTTNTASWQSGAGRVEPGRAAIVRGDRHGQRVTERKFGEFFYTSATPSRAKVHAVPPLRHQRTPSRTSRPARDRGLARRFRHGVCGWMREKGPRSARTPSTGDADRHLTVRRYWPSRSQACPEK